MAQQERLHHDSKGRPVYANCVVCGRDLTDAESVRRRMGPVCSGKYYQDAPPITPDGAEAVDAELRRIQDQLDDEDFVIQVWDGLKTGDSRRVANLLVNRIAVLADPPEVKEAMFNCLEHIGFGSLREAIQHNLYDIRIEPDQIADGRLLIWTPFDRAFKDDLKHTVGGRRWEKPHTDRKVWSVPDGRQERAQVLKLLERHFPGYEAYGPKGPFVIGANGHGQDGRKQPWVQAIEAGGADSEPEPEVFGRCRFCGRDLSGDVVPDVAYETWSEDEIDSMKMVHHSLGMCWDCAMSP